MFPKIWAEYDVARGYGDQNDSICVNWSILGLIFTTRIYMPYTPLPSSYCRSAQTSGLLYLTVKDVS